MKQFYNTVRQLHIEPSRKCNAQCPMCARYLGSSTNVAPWVNEEDVSIEKLTGLLEKLDLESISLNGNYGDIVMHYDPKSLIELCCHNAKNVVVHTNGGAQNKNFWKYIAKFKNLTVIFAIDGLSDTHHLYRRNTRFDVVINNAKTYIDAGGKAAWDMVIFKHNEHQVDECKSLSKELGFYKFASKPNARYGKSKYPVHNKNFEVEYYIESIDAIKNIENHQTKRPLETKKNYDDFVNADHTKHRSIKNSCISCRVIKDQSVFISADNRVWPCCWLGQMANKSESKFSYSDFEKNYGKQNIIENFDTIVKSFDTISQSWNTNTPFYECAVNCNVKHKADGVITKETSIISTSES